ncbi:hypothetical protein K491DRAFT_1538 [Lophiostoma macrostomum CBS 122681]|uniref:Nitrogen regulatory protein areA GATA-like domain-containing protein n=1 Tax=Lophiostoma macrostomum CBS 122681 TaxID=1314788 RepID=A0A6A6TUV4_9PLEO|nr:hypothetical protein K491DRAFT_1538 [Lophiostoma macrostomum CBS 122681]
MAEVLAMRNDAPFSHAPLHRSTSQTSFFDAGSSYATPRKNSYSHSDLRTSSFHSTPASSLSLDTRFDDDDDESDDDGIAFPSYSRGTRYSKYDVGTHDTPPSSPVVSNRALPSPVEADPVASTTSTPDFLLHSEDDTAVRPEPSHHVDYLSHEWKEEDIWSSWRHIVEHRKVYGERSRLENASWRTWAKSQFKLDTISPETLNWWVESFAYPCRLVDHEPQSHATHKHC